MEEDDLQAVYARLSAELDEAARALAVARKERGGPEARALEAELDDLETAVAALKKHEDEATTRLSALEEEAAQVREERRRAQKYLDGLPPSDGSPEGG